MNTSDTKTSTPELDACLQHGSEIAKALAEHCLLRMGASGCKIPVEIQIPDPSYTGNDDSPTVPVTLYVEVVAIEKRDREDYEKRVLGGSTVAYLLDNGAQTIRGLREIISRQAAKLEVFDVFAALTGMIKDGQRGGLMCAGEQAIESAMSDKAKQLSSIFSTKEESSNQQVLGRADRSGADSISASRLS